ncbi:MAG TPA: MoxR family ATPase [Candidatus Saccharimonadales bacterium]|nr:MoxR family ATPase [Candidatus Saccharimonadales bacterium]
MLQGTVAELNERVRAESEFARELTTEIGRVIVGQKYMVDRLLIGLLADGHLLLEGVPGLAKTLAVRCLAGAVQASFKRIQFTPDLLPADLTGTLIYNPREGTFSAKKGPLFANFVLADEINRAPAKVQSALLEAMQERQVTLGDETHALPEPFLVLATQNPIEQEGTYPLPEAQVDRFMLKLRIGYPTREEEHQILERMAANPPAVKPVVGTADILRARGVVQSLYVDEKIKEYIVRLVLATRDPESFGLRLRGLVAYGASPRATLCLAQASRAHAFLRGRGYVTPEDVKAVALDVLRHRIIVTYEAEAEEITPEGVAQRVLNQVEVP